MSWVWGDPDWVPPDGLCPWCEGEVTGGVICVACKSRIADRARTWVPDRLDNVRRVSDPGSLGLDDLGWGIRVVWPNGQDLVGTLDWVKHRGVLTTLGVVSRLNADCSVAWSRLMGSPPVVELGDLVVG